MGYGGFFKTVTKIVATVVGFELGGPIGAAIASAAATGATGGSFKEALISGATSYVGAQIGVSAGETLGNAAGIAGAGEAATAAESAFVGAPFPDIALAEASDLASSVAAEAAAGGTLTENLLSGIPDISKLNAPVSGGVTSNAPATIPGGWTTVDGAVSNMTNFDMFNSLKDKTFGDYLGAGIGAMAGMTIEQGLLAGTTEASAALKQLGFTDTAIAALTQEARNSLAQKKFDELVLTTPNPFKDDAEFRKVIAAGIERQNTSLGPSVTQQQWDSAFGGTDLGSQLLGQEQTLRRDAFTNTAKSAFPSEPMFKPANGTKLIDQLLSEQQGPAFDIIARSEARGNLNPYGGKTARETIEGQRAAGSEKLSGLEDVLTSKANQDIEGVKSAAQSAAQSYKLGDELFSPDTFRTQAEDIVTKRQGSFESDLRSLLGPEPLFDPTGAISSGGRVQGQVSGASPALLDAIANRTGTRNRERGLGNRGTGVF